MFIKYSQKGKRTDYLEFQICEINKDTDINEIISVANITHWKKSSLYVSVDDWDNFINEYGEYFYGGIQGNTAQGGIDMHGINYFTLGKTVKILADILLNKPKDFQILVEFLEKAKLKNGFYVLGI
jgi:hypothetical protein